MHACKAFDLFGIPVHEEEASAAVLIVSLILLSSAALSISSNFFMLDEVKALPPVTFDDNDNGTDSDDGDSGCKDDAGSTSLGSEISLCLSACSVQSCAVS